MKMKSSSISAECLSLSCLGRLFWHTKRTEKGRQEEKKTESSKKASLYKAEESKQQAVKPRKSTCEEAESLYACEELCVIFFPKKTSA